MEALIVDIADIAVIGENQMEPRLAENAASERAVDKS